MIPLVPQMQFHSSYHKMTSDLLPLRGEDTILRYFIESWKKVQTSKDLLITQMVGRKTYLRSEASTGGWALWLRRYLKGLPYGARPVGAGAAVRPVTLNQVRHLQQVETSSILVL